MTPRVSVVIPTFHRPQMIGRAVESVLNQTMQDLEVIVVMDGPQPETKARLDQIQDPRLRVMQHEERRRQAAAMNTGIRAAQAEWVAMLDDDDEWFPRKLEVQLATAEASDVERPIVGCRFIARSASGDVVWPFRLPRPGEPMAEYLFCRTQLRFGEGIQQTSTLLAPRDLFLEVPFLETERRHVDFGWLIQAARVPGVALIHPSDRTPLSIWNLEGTRHRGRSSSWWEPRDWARRMGPAMTPKAYAGFLLTQCSANRRRRGEFRACFPILWEAVRNGSPRAMDLAVWAMIWLSPVGLRTRVSRGFQKRKEAVAS